MTQFEDDYTITIADRGAGATRCRANDPQSARARLVKFLCCELPNRIWTVHISLSYRRWLDPGRDRCCAERRHGCGNGEPSARRNIGRCRAQQASGGVRGNPCDHGERPFDRAVAGSVADRFGGNTARFCQLGPRSGDRSIESRAGRSRRSRRKARSQRPVFGDRQRVRCGAHGHVWILGWGARRLFIDRGTRHPRFGRDRNDAKRGSRPG